MMFTRDEIREILLRIASHLGASVAANGMALKFEDGKLLFPSVSLEDALMLSARAGVGVKYYPVYNRVAATHPMVLDDIVEPYDRASDPVAATCKAVLRAADAAAKRTLGRQK